MALWYSKYTQTTYLHVSFIFIIIFYDENVKIMKHQQILKKSQIWKILKFSILDLDFRFRFSDLRFEFQIPDPIFRSQIVECRWDSQILKRFSNISFFSDLFIFFKPEVATLKSTTFIVGRSSNILFFFFHFYCSK